MTRIIDLPDAASTSCPATVRAPAAASASALRAITAALEGKMVMTVPASCLTVLGGMYPTASVDGAVGQRRVPVDRRGGRRARCGAARDRARPAR